MDKPKIPVDFNELAGNIVLLSQSDTKADSDGNLITLHEGMWVTVYDEDEEDGQPDNLIAEGIVVLNPLVKEHPAWAHVKWCCRIDQNGIKHESEFLPKIFSEIEALAKTDIDKALKRMVDIYPEVANSYYHEFADAINIWILTKGNGETRKYILDKLPCVSDEKIKSILREWADKLNR